MGRILVVRRRGSHGCGGGRGGEGVTYLQWPQSTKFSLLRTPFFSNKWCREENKWCGEENKWCREENKWCREENKWCREEKVYFGATILTILYWVPILHHFAAYPVDC